MKLPNGRQVKVTQELGQGAEGVVLGIQGTDDLCAKVYFEPADDITHRLDALKRHAAAEFRGDHDEHLHLAWPRERLQDDHGATVGFVMPRIEGVKLSRLTEREGRMVGLESPTWGMLVSIGERTARLVDRLHQVGVVMGDLSPANVLVTRTGHVTFIDCDTVQFVDPLTKRRHPCRKLTSQYAPPGAADGLLQANHDDFSLALLVTELLMVGQHPFDGVPTSGAGASIEENIRNQNNRIAFPDRMVDVPQAIPDRVLPPDVRALAVACFGEGHRDPTQRPSSAAWTQALSVAALQVMGCRDNVNHAYHRSLGECVWCARVRARLGDTFPGHQVRIVSVPAALSEPIPPWPIRRPPNVAPPPWVPVPPRISDPASVPAPASAPARPPEPVPTARPPQAASATKSGSNAWVAWVVVIVILLVFVLIAVAQ